ncbi:twin-arginine translocase TatA/TatE family subunit [Amycolatopsis sp. H20-H5]|uniref:twin-arginine translocase TatA/TatE family subunit n=1 Tax=Amycolatopsis sp. H20-H5 TaxID=3046309 RepID=UPI002DBFEF37|nr:twin-arginine translocase TatA/TatE family subunit [Amycolatopsis sp. H20-H5]MEC3980953.1 twin-arginine translocase TatA/TatE family subunit [Amycolatopsis sp. H20-H5]
MFGLSLEHLLILLVAGLFILGPERLPESAQWLAQTMRRVRDYASGAQEQLRAELGPEFQDLRKPLRDLQALREFNPRTVVNRYLLDDTLTTERTMTATPAGGGQVSASTATAAVRPLEPGERAPVDPDAT